MPSVVEPGPTTAACDAAVREANTRLTAGDTEGAVAILVPLTSDDEIYLPARFLLAMTAWKMGQLDWSIELLRQCHDAFPMNGTVAEILASLYAQAGDLRESLFLGKLGTALGSRDGLFEFVPREFPTFDWSFYHIKEQPLLVDARACLAGGKPRDALEKARQHVALHPQDGDAHGFYASVLLQNGYAAVAVEVLKAIAARADLPAPYASLYARALTQVGEFDDARHWHERAMSRAPDDLDIAAAGILDSFWLEESVERRRAMSEDWARLFCKPGEGRDWQPPTEKLIIGYLISSFDDPLDMAAVAAVAQAHDRARVATIAYVHGEQSWETLAPLSGAFDTWRDIRSLNPATLARFFQRDGLHVAIDTGGFAAPDTLLALARLNTALRVSWFGNPGALGTPIYDARIVAESAAKGGPESWGIPCGYPVSRAGNPTHATPVHDGFNFGADATMAQLDAETVRRWSQLLDAKPDAKLLLRANDMEPGANIDRLIARFGVDHAARIDVVADESVEEFYAKVDVALLPRRSASARAAADAVSCAVPPVAVAGTASDEPYVAFLSELGLRSRLVATDDAEFVSIAAGLAAPAARNRLVAELRAAAGDNAGACARAIEDHAARALGQAVGAPS